MMTIRKVQLMKWVLAGAMVAAPLAGLAQDSDQQQAPPPDGQAAYNQGYQDGVASVTQAPPAIPQYDQPEAPGDGYIWTPGYWAWGPAGYYWVPGAWVEAPYEGALWTPGYWGFNDGLYFWNAGYWGPVVGYYGGVNYGFGYFGVGFYGGYWNGGHFFYNREYWHVGAGVRFGYRQRVTNISVERPGGASFSSVNGGHAPGFVARGGTFNTRGQEFAAHGGAAQPAMRGGGYAGPRGAAAPSSHYSAPEPHYSAPAPHYSAPAPHYSAPASHPAPAAHSAPHK